MKKHYVSHIEQAVNRTSLDRFATMLERNEFADQLLKLCQLADKIDGEIDDFIRAGGSLRQRWSDIKKEQFRQFNERTPKRQPILWSLPPRKARAETLAQARRSLSYRPKDLQAYAWPITCFPAGVTITDPDADPERFDIVTEFDDFQKAFSLRQNMEEEERMKRIIAWRAAKHFQKECKRLFIPVEIEVHHQTVYFAPADAGFMTRAERDLLIEAFEAAARKTIGVYLAGAYNGDVQTGHVVPDGERKRELIERFGIAVQ